MPETSNNHELFLAKTLIDAHDGKLHCTHDLKEKWSLEL